MYERELLDDIRYTNPDGSLNQAAAGWARRPLIDTSGLGSALGWDLRKALRWDQHRWGRNKRWEYWNVITPTHILALVVSSIDYAAVTEVWILDRDTEQTWAKDATIIPARGVELPPRLGAGPVRAKSSGLAIAITQEQYATGANYGGEINLAAKIDQASFNVIVSRPQDHDCLAVVVPWSDRTFQYTVKDVALPASGTVTIEGVEYEVPAGQSWAVLDHGRGRWPYNIRWNWGAGAGISNGHTIGIQVGGQWTADTGATENGFLVDGHLHKISEELTWSHSLPDNWRSPWHVVGGGLDATLTPFYDKITRTNLGVLAGSTDQCYGTWSGSFTPGSAGSEGFGSGSQGPVSARTIYFDGIVGFAEEVHNRW